MGTSTAREHCRVALALRDWPEVTEKFRAGELSYTQVRAITRVADPATEVELLALAEGCTAATLERVVRAWRKGVKSGVPGIPPATCSIQKYSQSARWARSRPMDAG